jgi:hypothetical protein
MKRLLLIGAAALSLTACATPNSAANDAIDIAQGDTTVDALYNVAATAYMNQLPTMPAATKAVVKPLLVQALPWVQKADAAATLGNAATVAADAAEATALITQAKTALGVK